MWKKKYKKTEKDGDNLEDTIEMFLKDLIASRSRSNQGEIQLKKKVSTNIERKEISTLIRADTYS